MNLLITSLILFLISLSLLLKPSSCRINLMVGLVGDKSIYFFYLSEAPCRISVMLLIILFSLWLANYLDGFFDELETPADSSTLIISCIRHIYPPNLVLKNLCLLSSTKLALSSVLNFSILQKKSAKISFSDPEVMLF